MSRVYDPQAHEKAQTRVRALAEAKAKTPERRRALDAQLDKWNRHLSTLDARRTEHYANAATSSANERAAEDRDRARFRFGPGRDPSVIDADGRITAGAYAKRHALIMKRWRRGDAALTPDERAFSRVRDEGEDLWARALVHGEKTPVMTRADIKRWSDWQVRELKMRAIANPLSSTVAADGGNVVPTDYVADVFRDMALAGPMLNPALVNLIQTASGRDLDYPTETGGKTRKVALLTVGADQAAAKTVFGKVTFKAPEWGDLFALPWTLVQDSSVPIEQVLREIMVEAGVRGLNEALTVGDNTGSNPQGINRLPGDRVVAGKNNAGGRASWEDALKAIHQVNPIYRSSPKCAFVMHDSVVEHLRSETFASDSSFVWQVDARSGQPATLFGYPVYVNQAIPARGGGVPFLYFGDFAGYGVRLVTQMGITRLDEIGALARQYVLQYVLRADGRYLSTDRFAAIRPA